MQRSKKAVVHVGAEIRSAKAPHGSLAVTSDHQAILIVRHTEAKTCLTIEQLQAEHSMTPQEARVALMLLLRRTNKEIAEVLKVTEKTVHSHVRSVLFKLGVSSRYNVEDVLIPAIMAAWVPVPESDGSADRRTA